MKILFVIPEVFDRAEGYTKEDIGYIGFPSLTAATIAGLTPKDVVFEAIDEIVDPLEESDFKRRVDADVVAISLNMTYKANRATEIARRFQEMGKKVIWGGVHVTSVYDFHRERFEKEIAPFADAVVLEEAELVWPVLIDDLKSGNLKKIYRSPRPKAKEIPSARREVLNTEPFLVQNSIQATRGCPLNCEFCAVTSFNGPVFRIRDVSSVAAEIRGVLINSAAKNDGWINRYKKSLIGFVDDNVAFDKNYLARLCLELERIKSEFPAFRWGGQCTLNTIEKNVVLNGKTTRLADLMRRSGCLTMFVGIESVSRESLKSVGKNFNQPEKFAEQIRKFHDAGISIIAGMIVGLEEDGEGVFEDIYEFLTKNKVELSLINILTPLPGTALYRRYEKEGILIDYNWEHYDGRHAVYRPKRMSPERLEKSFFELWNALYGSDISIAKRLIYPSSVWRIMKNPSQVIRMFSHLLTNRKYGEISERMRKARNL